jgi:glyoxylase-like metal-dependent hydrolase (beta-lactamase superfamily II)
MIHEILPVGMLRCNCSVFGDEQSGEAIVIDPGDDIPAIQAVLDRHGLKVKAIVITHAHIDHIGGAARLKKLTGAPVYLNAQDAVLQDMMDVQAGWLGVETPERAEIDMPDTLFRDSIGRTDLPGGDGDQILRSIQQKLLALPDETIVIPGHGANTTIGREKDTNYFLQGL